MKSTPGAILVTGASGFLGRLICAGLIAQGHSKLVLPVRAQHSRGSMLAAIDQELQEMGYSQTDLSGVQVIPLPAIHAVSTLRPVMEEERVEQIIHAAGSLDYFNSQSLKSVNIDLTSELITLSEKLKLDRFIFISTAFSSGFTPGRLITERLHEEPESDPTEYTSSKRHAEAIIAAGTTPYLIVRPSVVIGDSRTGRYNGKQFGLYQFWGAADRFLSDLWREDFYIVAPKMKLQVIHQDAFLQAFLEAYKKQPENSFIHLVSRPHELPTVRDAFKLWARAYTRPRRVIFINSVDDAPAGALDKRLRMWFEFTAVNHEIASYPWNFEYNSLEKLRAGSEMDFRDATIETIENCQTKFLTGSSRIKEYHHKYRNKLCSNPEVIELSGLMQANLKVAVGD